MKKISLIITAIALLAVSCKKNTQQKTSEDKKVDSLVKSEKEKGDSVLRHYEQMMESLPDTLPEMK